MAKFRDEVEILIAARDQASAEMRRVREEVKKTRASLNERDGAVAGAADLYQNFLKAAAAADAVRSSMDGLRGIIRGVKGDSEEAKQAIASMGLGIGPTVRAMDDLRREILGIREVEEAIEQRRQEGAAFLKQQNDAWADQVMIRHRARIEAEDLEQLLVRQLEIQRAETEEEKKLVAIRHAEIDAERQMADLRSRFIGGLDPGGRTENQRKAFIDRLNALRAELVAQERLKILEEQRLKNAEKLAEAQAHAADELKAMREEQGRSFNSLLTSSFQSTLDGLRQRRAAIADRRGTIALGDQSGRFVTGLRDQAAAREEGMQAEVRRLREDLDKKISAVESALNKVVQAMTGNDRVQLIPASIAAGRVF